MLESRGRATASACNGCSVPRAVVAMLAAAAMFGVMGAQDATKHVDQGRLQKVDGGSADEVKREGVRTFDVAVPGTAITLTMVEVPGGRVVVDDPRRAGETMDVEVGAFAMMTTEMTWDLFDVFVFGLDEDEGVDGGRAADGSPPPADRHEGGAAGNGKPDAVTRPSKPYVPPDRGFGHSGWPAISMTFHSATEFCKWLSAKTGRSFRLPTEAEWELAARGGVLDGGHVDSATAADIAWHAGNAGGKTHEVGTLAANALGLFDMYGNVAEWCARDTGGGTVIGVAAGGSYLDVIEKIGPDARVMQSRDWNRSDPQMPKSKWWLADCTFVGFRIVCDVAHEDVTRHSGDGGVQERREDD